MTWLLLFYAYALVVTVAHFTPAQVNRLLEPITDLFFPSEVDTADARLTRGDQEER